MVMLKKIDDQGARKEYVISVRIPNELGKEFDNVADFLPLNKTDFITECVRKLVDDNLFLMENHHIMIEIIEDIRQELKKVPEKYLKVIHGTVENINDIAIISLCDFLFVSYKDFRESMKGVKSYFEKDIEFLLDMGADSFGEFKDEFVLTTEEISLMMLPKQLQIPAEEIIHDKKWSDLLETKKMFLLLAADDLFAFHTSQKIISSIISEPNERKTSLKKVISDIIKEADERRDEEHILIIDAEGRFRRGKDMVYYPVYLETIERFKRFEESMKASKNETK